jgi:hypothetical protein
MIIIFWLNTYSVKWLSKCYYCHCCSHRCIRIALLLDILVSVTNHEMTDTHSWYNPSLCCYNSCESCVSKFWLVHYCLLKFICSWRPSRSMRSSSDGLVQPKTIQRQFSELCFSRFFSAMRDNKYQGVRVMFNLSPFRSKWRHQHSWK